MDRNLDPNAGPDPLAHVRAFAEQVRQATMGGAPLMAAATAATPMLATPPVGRPGLSPALQAVVAARRMGKEPAMAPGRRLGPTARIGRRPNVLSNNSATPAPAV